MTAGPDFLLVRLSEDDCPTLAQRIEVTDGETGRTVPVASISVSLAAWDVIATAEVVGETRPDRVEFASRYEVWGHDGGAMRLRRIAS